MRKRLILICLLNVMACNGALLFWLLPIPVASRVVLSVLLAVVYILFLIRPSLERLEDWRMKFLAGGCHLIASAAVCSLAQLFVYLSLLLPETPMLVFPFPVWVTNTAIFLVLESTMVFHAMARLFAASARLTRGHRLFLVMLWWMPLVNLVAFLPIHKKAWQEYQTGIVRYKRNYARKDERVCQTKYPLLMVHGIFFRDWTLMNYWGRIPGELETNGATIFYGEQDSAESVAESAKTLRRTILRLLREEQCEKVNIIAHSKGGLDARYAISCLNMGQYVASLTTVNTPHRGCRFAKQALDKLPENLTGRITSLYEQIFSRLGDKHPDFYSGVSDLTDVACRALNADMPDDPRVFYQSVGSRMAGAESAGFPLNLGYQIIQPLDGDNDGLVAVDSMRWGKFTFWPPVGNDGISHGDVIDLTRRDVPGFDVCERYVALVADLKARGL